MVAKNHCLMRLRQKQGKMTWDTDEQNCRRIADPLDKASCILKKTGSWSYEVKVWKN